MNNIKELQKLAGINKSKMQKIKEKMRVWKKDVYRWVVYLAFIFFAKFAPKSKIIKRINIIFHRVCFY